jgi:hypothetical protein
MPRFEKQNKNSNTNLKQDNMLETNQNKTSTGWMKDEFPDQEEVKDTQEPDRNDDDGDKKPKRKFLARGAGTAGGVKMGKVVGKTPLKNQRSPIRGAKEPNTQALIDEINHLNSIDDFKNLEDSVKEQNYKFKNTYIDNQRKN